MDRAHVCQYIKDQFHVVGSYRWRRFPDNCVFVSPITDRWWAVLIKQNDDPLHLTDNHVQQYLDIYTGPDIIKLRGQGQFGDPHMMSAQDWVGVALNDQNDDEQIEAALNRAFQLTSKPNDVAEQEQLLQVGQSTVGNTEKVYYDRKLPLAPRVSSTQKVEVELPAPLHKMKSLYDYSLPPVTGRNRNFYVQGQSVADYQDNYDFHGEFKHFYPTYHDMSDRELRGYFSWRTKFRAGDVEPAPRSFLYVYLYELINQIGVPSPEDGFKQLAAFSQQVGQQADKKMRAFIKQWLKDYVVYYQLADQYKQQAFADDLQADHAYSILLKPTDQSDHDLTKAIDDLATYHFADKCPLMKKQPAIAEQLVADAWRQLHRDETGGDAAALVGWRGEVTVRLFGSAVFYNQEPVASRVFQVDDQREYRCNWGVWHRRSVTPLKGRTKKLNAFLHEVDRQIRRHFKLGRQLKPQALPDDQLAAIHQAWVSYQEKQTAKRQRKVAINLDHLAKIRADAAVTAESLLTDEEKQAEAQEVAAEQKSRSSENLHSDQPATPVTSQETDRSDNDLGLSNEEIHFLSCLLADKPYQDYLKSHHLMSSILADQINEKMFDEIGDTVIEFDNDGQAQLVEDYRDDVKNLLS